MRSRAAASVFEHAGFKEAYSLAGGIHAWEGSVAEGVPDTAWFFAAENEEQMLALGWLVEEGTRTFYEEMAVRMDDPQLLGIFSGLAQAESKHQKMLNALWPALTGRKAPPDSPMQSLENPPKEPLLEHGLLLRDALGWCEGKSAREVMEFALSMETAAYDRYLRMFDETPLEETRTIFLKLAEEEKEHLHRLSAELDRLLE